MIREAAAENFFEQYVRQDNIDWQCTGLANLVAFNCRLCYNRIYETVPPSPIPSTGPKWLCSVYRCEYRSINNHR